MRNKSNVKCGSTITNTNGRKYKVLATRKDYHGQQDFIVEDINGPDIIVAHYWDPYPNTKDKYGTWGFGTYYLKQELSLSDYTKLLNRFKKKR